MKIMKKNKPIKLKAKVVFEWEYDVKPENYTSKELPLEKITVEDMIRIDKGGFEGDLWLFLDSCINSPTLELTVVDSENE